MKRSLVISVATAALLGSGVSAYADDKVDLELGGFFIGHVSVSEDAMSTISDGLHSPDAYKFEGESEVQFEGVSSLDNGLRYGFKAQVTVSNDVNQANTKKDEDKELLDEAFLFVESGFGRVELGQQRGVANKFSVGSPHALNNMTISPGRNDQMVDPLNLTKVGTANDSSDDYAKITYMTPSFGGLKLGMSFTPDVETRAVGLTPDVLDKKGEDIVEFGVIYSRDFENLSLDMSATYLTADSTPITGELEEWNAGVNVGFRGLSVGGSYRESGTLSTGLQRYEAYDIGVAYETGPWKVSAQYAEHDRQLAGAPVEDGYRYLISARYKVAKGLRFGAGFQRDLDTLSEEEGSAFILESALKF